MSLMSALYTGVSGLGTSQRGLTVASHNLANVETDGFVRQQMESTDALYITQGYNHIGYLQIGYGSQVSSVKQVRDSFLDRTYREEIGRQDFYKSQYEATMEVEDIFGELQGVAFQESMKNLWVSLQEVCKEPDSIVTRASFIQTSVSFIERAEEVYAQIKEYQESLNTQVKTYVDKINTLAQDIFQLNHQIQKIEASGFENANDLRDARNLKLDELSKIVKIDYKEDQTGVVTVYAEGYALVTDDLVFRMDTRYCSETSTLIEPYWVDYDKVDVFDFSKIPTSQADTDIGGLKGLLLARGSKQGQFTDIPRKPEKEEFTDPATGILNELDYNDAMRSYNKAVEVYEIEVEASVCVSIQAQFDNLIHGITTTINDILCPNKEVNIVAADGSIQKIKILDEENAPVGMDGAKSQGEALFNRKSVTRYDEQVIKVLNPDGTTTDMLAQVYREEDPTNNYSLFTVGEIEVNPAVLKNPSVIPLSDNRGTGDFTIDICDTLMTAWQGDFDVVSPSAYQKLNFNSYYTEMVGLLGTNGEKFKHVYRSQENLASSVDNERQATMAVSSDEELTNIIRYQQGYNANSRFISVVNDMLDHLLRALG